MVQAGQDFSPSGRLVKNRGELLGSQVVVTAKGTYEPQVSCHSTQSKASGFQRINMLTGLQVLKFKYWCHGVSLYIIPAWNVWNPQDSVQRVALGLLQSMLQVFHRQTRC